MNLLKEHCYSALWLSVWVTFLLLTGCNANYEAMAKKRIDYARNNTGKIVIAAIGDSNHSQYINGIKLAVEEINESEKGLLGRPLELSIKPAASDVSAAKSLIRRIASNPEVSLVLGHSSDKVVLRASALYEQSKLLFFPPLSQTKELTSHGYLFTFRMLPDNTHMAEQISNEIQAAGYKQIAVLNSHMDQQRQLSLVFQGAATKSGLNIVYTHSFFADMMDYRALLSGLKDKSFDAVFLSADERSAARLIHQMREMGIDKPVFGSNELNSEGFITAIGMSEHKTIVPGIYDVSAKNWVNQHFVARYRGKYHQTPNADAAQGYDSVMLFANKVIKAQTTQPDILASTIRFSQPWRGVTGCYSFNKKGELKNKRFYFQVLNKGIFQPFLITPPLLKAREKTTCE